ncbi:unnamed protein product [Amoebophrya sp. A25]|nr:unnamed protein product [Amoebophrya sp. A25]|eukprot:GSA25T00019060001.1
MTAVLDEQLLHRSWSGQELISSTSASGVGDRSAGSASASDEGTTGNTGEEDYDYDFQPLQPHLRLKVEGEVERDRWKFEQEAAFVVDEHEEQNVLAPPAEEIYTPSYLFGEQHQHRHSSAEHSHNRCLVEQEHNSGERQSLVQQEDVDTSFPLDHVEFGHALQVVQERSDTASTISQAISHRDDFLDFDPSASEPLLTTSKSNVSKATTSARTVGSTAASTRDLGATTREEQGDSREEQEDGGVGEHHGAGEEDVEDGCAPGGAAAEEKHAGDAQACSAEAQPPQQEASWSSSPSEHPSGLIEQHQEKVILPNSTDTEGVEKILTRFENRRSKNALELSLSSSSSSTGGGFTLREAKSAPSGLNLAGQRVQQDTSSPGSADATGGVLASPDLPIVSPTGNDLHKILTASASGGVREDESTTPSTTLAPILGSSATSSIKNNSIFTASQNGPALASSRGGFGRTTSSPANLHARNNCVMKEDPWRGWRILIDRFYLYYYNPVRNESVWELPRDLYGVLGEWKPIMSSSHTGERFWFNSQAQLSLWDDPRRTCDVFSAVLTGNTLFLHLFFECAGDLEVAHPDTGASLVHYAVASGNWKVLDFLLRKLEASKKIHLLNRTDKEGMEPLVYTVRTGYWNLVRPLCEAGADVGNALALAQSAGALECIRELFPYASEDGKRDVDALLRASGMFPHDRGRGGLRGGVNDASLGFGSSEAHNGNAQISEHLQVGRDGRSRGNGLIAEDAPAFLSARGGAEDFSSGAAGTHGGEDGNVVSQNTITTTSSSRQNNLVGGARQRDTEKSSVDAMKAPRGGVGGTTSDISSTSEREMEETPKVLRLVSNIVEGVFGSWEDDEEEFQDASEEGALLPSRTREEELQQLQAQQQEDIDAERSRDLRLRNLYEDMHKNLYKNRRSGVLLSTSSLGGSGGGRPRAEGSPTTSMMQESTQQMMGESSSQLPSIDEGQNKNDLLEHHEEGQNGNISMGKQPHQHSYGELRQTATPATQHDSYYYNGNGTAAGSYDAAASAWDASHVGNSTRPSSPDWQPTWQRPDQQAHQEYYNNYAGVPDHSEYNNEEVGGNTLWQSTEAEQVDVGAHDWSSGPRQEHAVEEDHSTTSTRRPVGSVPLGGNSQDDQEWQAWPQQVPQMSHSNGTPHDDVLQEEEQINHDYYNAARTPETPAAKSMFDDYYTGEEAAQMDLQLAGDTNKSSTPASKKEDKTEKEFLSTPQQSPAPSCSSTAAPDSAFRAMSPQTISKHFDWASDLTTEFPSEEELGLNSKNFLDGGNDVEAGVHVQAEPVGENDSQQTLPLPDSGGSVSPMCSSRPEITPEVLRNEDDRQQGVKKWSQVEIDPSSKTRSSTSSTHASVVQQHHNHLVRENRGLCQHQENSSITTREDHNINIVNPPQQEDAMMTTNKKSGTETTTTPSSVDGSTRSTGVPPADSAFPPIPPEEPLGNSSPRRTVLDDDHEGIILDVDRSHAYKNHDDRTRRGGNKVGDVGRTVLPEDEQTTTTHKIEDSIAFLGGPMIPSSNDIIVGVSSPVPPSSTTSPSRMLKTSSYSRTITTTTTSRTIHHSMATSSSQLHEEDLPPAQENYGGPPSSSTEDSTSDAHALSPELSGHPQQMGLEEIEAELGAIPIPNLSPVIDGVVRNRGIRPPDARPVPRALLVLPRGCRDSSGTGGSFGGGGRGSGSGGLHSRNNGSLGGNGASSLSALGDEDCYDDETSCPRRYAMVLLKKPLYVVRDSRVVSVLGTFWRLARQPSAIIRSVANVILNLFPPLVEETRTFHQLSTVEEGELY